jgi:hypothetical protein
MPPRSAAAANSWSMHDVRRLRELAQAGVPIESIAATLGRTRAAIRNKAGFHAISLRRSSSAAGQPGHDAGRDEKPKAENRMSEESVEARDERVRSAAGRDAGAHAGLHQ